jgi:hypothetical protein
VTISSPPPNRLSKPQEPERVRLREHRSTGSRLLDSVQICHASLAWVLKRRLIPVASGLFCCCCK